MNRGYILRGRVQGVGFRWWTARIAEQHGVVGTVRNLRDGSVEVMAQASPETLVRFEDQLRKGPPMARVDEVENIECVLPDGVSHFDITR